MMILHFYVFHKFLQVFLASRSSRKTYWHLADRRCSGSDPEKNGTPVFNEFLRVSSEHRKLEKHQNNSAFRNTYWYTATGVPPGSSRVLFFRIPEIRKTHFSEKGPRSEKTRHFTISYGFSSKERSADFRPPRIFRKSLKNVSKSDPKTNSEKKRDLVFVLGRKGSETWLLGRSRGLSVWTSGLQNAHFGPQRPDKNANPRNKLMQKILQKIHARNLGYPNAQKHFRCGGLAQAS